MSSRAADRRDRAHEASAFREYCEELRVEAIRTRILTLNTFVGIAETQLRYHSPQQAQLSFRKIHRAVSEIEFHLQEPRHIPPEAAAELRVLLEGIKVNIEALRGGLNAANSPTVLPFRS